MLCKKREIVINGEVALRTPILLPSFSSKGFEREHVAKIFQYCSELITDEILVSLYDLHYKFIPKKFDFPEAIFVDSGGYEISDEFDLSDVRKTGLRTNTRPWTRATFQKQLKSIRFSRPAIFVSYDHPKSRLPIDGQIKRAKEDFALLGVDAGKEILFKADGSKVGKNGDDRYLNLKEIIKRRHELAYFNVIGVTEKELGPSTFERMKAIATLRKSLSEINLDIPIHVFGSLDTISTPLYFLAGADIFDGLTWLRYSYMQGFTTYKHNFAAKDLGIDVKDYAVEAQVINRNYYYLKRLKEQMICYLNSSKFSEFEFHSDLFERATKMLNESFNQNHGGA